MIGLEMFFFPYSTRVMGIAMTIQQIDNYCTVYVDAQARESADTPLKAYMNRAMYIQTDIMLSNVQWHFKAM